MCSIFLFRERNRKEKGEHLGVWLWQCCNRALELLA